jgi:hypothetical protein
VAAMVVMELLRSFNSIFKKYMNCSSCMENIMVTFRNIKHRIIV